MDTITPRPRAAWVAGNPETGARTLAVTHPYDGTEVATVSLPDADQVERAVVAAERVARELRFVPTRQRTNVLERVARGMASRSEELAEMITAESGKPLRWAEAEVADAVATLLAASRSAGETRRMECDLTGEGRASLVRRVPRGPAVGVVPSRTPLAPAARAVGAALAVGAPVLLAPSPRAPMSALGLGELLANTDLPNGSFSVLPTADTEALTSDPRLMTVPGNGGGEATAVVLADWLDVERAATCLAAAAMGQAGQSYLATRRVVVEAGIADEFLPRLTEAVRAQRTGDPYDSDVSVGPMGDEAAAEQVVAWVRQAVSAGATLLTGGTRDGTTVEPTLLADSPGDAAAARDAVPGPVLTVSVVDTAEQAFAAAAGYRTGVFTRDIELALEASGTLDSDEVVIGDVPGYRPEAVRGAMYALTTERIIVLPGSVR